jgi:hypothetical protein
MYYEELTALKNKTPIRVQWDPERDLYHNSLPERTIQIGIGGFAVEKYVNECIQQISDITELAHRIKALVDRGDIESAKSLLPDEKPYL